MNFIRRRGLSRGQVEAEIAESSGQLPYLILTPSPSTTGVAWPSNNLAIGIRFRVSEATPVTALDIWVGTAGSANVDGGIYTSIDEGATQTRITASGATAAAGAGARQALAYATPYVLLPDTDYWSWLSSDSTGLQVARQALPAGVGGYKNWVVSKATSHPLPATISTPVTVSGGYMPWMAIG